VSYTNPKSSLSTGTMWIEERNVVTNVTLFAQASHLLSFSSPGLLQFLSSNGATIGADAFQFITGATSIFGITLSYTVQAGGVGYNPPILNYYSNGTQYVSTITQQPTTYYMDDGSSWSVTSVLQGSNSTERWTALQPTNGIVSSGETNVLVYDHQFQVTIDANPPGAGTTQPSGANWYEAGSQIPIQGQGSNPYVFAEWQAASFTFGNAKSFSTFTKISGPGTIDAKFSVLALTLPEYSGNITQGANKSFNATLTGIGVQTSLSILGLPAGATGTFVVNPALPNSAGLGVPFTITIPSSITPGPYDLTILANSSQGSDAALYLLHVTKAVPLTFELTGASTPQAVLSYTFNGVILLQNLSATPRTLNVDYGSSWNVNPILPGSNTTLRWITNANTNGTAINSATVSLAYFQQYVVNFGIQIPDGSVPSGSAWINITSFGSPSTIMLNKTGSTSWVDASSLYSFSSVIPSNSSATERWAIGSNQSGRVFDSETLRAVYYHQFLLMTSYNVLGGGNPSAPPVLTSRSFGRAQNMTLQSQDAGNWLDSGSSWSVSKLLPGSNTNERWIIVNSTGTGKQSSGGSANLGYEHQYFVRVVSDTAQGGKVRPATGWYNASEPLQISENAAPGWRFMGWESTESSSNGTLVVSGPANVSGLFYPGITISAPANAELTYSYGVGAGTITEGSSTTIFVPIGTSLALKVSPSSIFYTLNSWRLGNVSVGTSPNYTLFASNPTVLGVALDYNYTLLGIILGGLFAGGLIGLFAFRKKRRSFFQEISGGSDSSALSAE
ncbi:MAG: hypothetical protein OK457_02900, partial [Thaumarchaeota archaeon]|nr:hypothetical protein [Nitrososphaerota archaeon]